MNQIRNDIATALEKVEALGRSIESLRNDIDAAMVCVSQLDTRFGELEKELHPKSKPAPETKPAKQGKSAPADDGL
jgi:hypothetical protein